MKVSPVWLTMLGAVVRHGLTLIMAPLVLKGILTEEMILSAVPDVVAWLVVLGALAWSFIQKWLADRKVEEALDMPAGATREQLEESVSAK